jgi:hydrogenase maturation protease
MSDRVLIVAVGRSKFGDDAIGLVIAGKLQRLLGDVARVVIDKGGGWETLEVIDEESLLILIDAAEENVRLPAGSWCRIKFPEHADAIECCRLRDTHTMSVGAMLEMGGTLGRLPRDVWIYAVAGERFAPETDLSPRVSRIVDQVAERVTRDVRSWLTKQNPDVRCQASGAQTNSSDEGPFREL